MTVSKKYPKKIQSILCTPGSGLEKLVATAENLIALEQKLCSILPPPLNLHCKISGLSNQSILLITDSSVWATKLRFMTPEILKFMKSECSSSRLKSVRISIRPEVYNKTSQPGRKITLTTATSRIIKNIANNIHDDELRSSLHKIARHSESNT